MLSCEKTSTFVHIQQTSFDIIVSHLRQLSLVNETACLTTYWGTADSLNSYRALNIRTYTNHSTTIFIIPIVNLSSAHDYSVSYYFTRHFGWRFRVVISQ